MFGWFAAREVIVLGIYTSGDDVTGINGAFLTVIAGFLCTAAYPIGALVTLRAWVAIFTSRCIGDRHLGDDLDILLDLAVGGHAPGDFWDKSITSFFGFAWLRLWFTAGDRLVFDMGATSIRATGIVGAFVFVVTINRSSSLTGAIGADIAGGAGVAIVTGGDIIRFNFFAIHTGLIGAGVGVQVTQGTRLGLGITDNSILSTAFVDPGVGTDPFSGTTGLPRLMG